ncbi:MAG: SRPBCC family protein [Bacteroidota bacterium]
MSKNQSSYHFHHTIGINCEQAEAWQLLTNVSDWHKWDTEIKKAAIFGEFGLGVRGELIPKTGPKLSFEISEYSEGNFYAFKTKMPVGYLLIKRELYKKGKITYFKDDIQFTGLLKRLFGIMLGRDFKTVLPEVMQNFKHILENEHSK